MSRVAELERALQTKRQEITEASAAFKFEDGDKIVVTTEVKDAYLAAVKSAKDIQALIEAEREVKQLNEWMDAPAGTPAAARDAADNQRAQGREFKSFGDMVIESETFQSERKNANPHIKVEFDDSIINLSQKDIYGTSAGRTGGDVTLPGLGRVQNLGITEARLRQKHVRSLFPNASTDAAVLYGVREVGFSNAAAAVPVRSGGDFGLKPTSNLELQTVLYPVATIAHILRAHKGILDDEPRLRDFLNRRMTDGVMLAEDWAMLYGTGANESVTGIMNVPGVQAYTGLNTDPYSAQLRRAATLAMISEYEPNGVVLHPTDWEALELEETTDGHYRIAINVAIGGEKRIWSMDIVSTTAMTAGDFLLGSFGLGAQWYDREKVNVQISTEDSDNFRRNAVTIRAEERGALVVDRPEAFVVGDFTTPV